MAFSGIGKLIKDLVTGTPADTDYFAFGNTDLKKVSFPNLKKALGIDALNSALGTFKYWDDVSTGESGDTTITMKKTMRAEHMYLILIRRLDGSVEVYPPYGYLLFMRSGGWKSCTIGVESEVSGKKISNGLLTLTFENTQWTRMVVYEVM